VIGAPCSEGGKRYKPCVRGAKVAQGPENGISSPGETRQGLSEPPSQKERSEKKKGVSAGREEMAPSRIDPSLCGHEDVHMTTTPDGRFEVGETFVKILEEEKGASRFPGPEGGRAEKKKKKRSVSQSTVRRKGGGALVVGSNQSNLAANSRGGN